MRDPNRIDAIIWEIAAIWHDHPDLRLGQLICNIVDESVLYYIEDEEMLRCLKESIFYKTR